MTRRLLPALFVFGQLFFLWHLAELSQFAVDWYHESRIQKEIQRGVKEREDRAYFEGMQNLVSRQTPMNTIGYDSASNSLWVWGGTIQPGVHVFRSTSGKELHVTYTPDDSDGWPNSKDCPWDEKKEARVCR